LRPDALSIQTDKLGIAAVSRLANSNMSSAPPPRRNLRIEQKEATRLRIRQAARELFDRQGYTTVQVDQIAKAAGVSRAAFYLHFKDKEAILVDIALDYTPRIVALMRRLEGPQPSLEVIQAWMAEWVALMTMERAVPAIFNEVVQREGRRPPYVVTLVDQIITALAESLPAFDAAARDNPRRDQARAWADILIIEATRTACAVVGRGDDPYCKAALDVVAEMFEHFLTDGRFATPTPDINGSGEGCDHGH
jgi:AcrR family transcriptional regulator